MKYKKILPLVTLTSIALSSSALAANWSSTALHVNNGDQKNPFTKQESDTTVWLVNTGWTGGPYGTGSRMPIRATRALLTAALDGSLSKVEFRKDENFGFEVPVTAPGVAEVLLSPRRTWDDSGKYDIQATKLVKMFADNFAQYLPYIKDDVKAAAI